MMDVLANTHQLLDALIEQKPTAELVRQLAVDLDEIAQRSIFIKGGPDADFVGDCLDTSEVLREANWNRIELDNDRLDGTLTLFSDDYRDDSEEETQTG